MEFLVASGDAAKEFEASKEVFDPVAFAIEMLVKRGLDCAICLRSDHRNTTELMHVGADGVAVVSLGHDRKGGGLEIFRDQRFGLI